MGEETPGSIGLVVKDLVRSAVLVAGMGGVEGLKHWVFRDGPPVALVVLLNLGELTLAVSFLIALLKALAELWRHLGVLFSSRKKTGDGQNSGSRTSGVMGAVGRGIVSAGSLGMGVGMFICLLLAVLYVCALTGHVSAVVYFAIIGIGVAVILVSIVFAVIEYKALEGAESGIVVFMFIAAFVTIVIGGLALISLANRYVLDGMLDQFLAFLLLRR